MGQHVKLPFVGLAENMDRNICLKQADVIAGGCRDLLTNSDSFWVVSMSLSCLKARRLNPSF
jgi:hypothetical protein